MTDLPDSWDDEPWPLDDPVPAPSFRPHNWSDTHHDPPQVADLADDAWQRAVDRRISMEQALVEMQREREHPVRPRDRWTVTVNGVDLSSAVNDVDVSIWVASALDPWSDDE